MSLYRNNHKKEYSCTTSVVLNIGQDIVMFVARHSVDASSIIGQRTYLFYEVTTHDAVLFLLDAAANQSI